MPSTSAPLAPPASPLERLPEEWAEALAAWGEPTYRALQVFRWIHARSVCDPEQMTDLPRTLRARLADDGLAAPLTLARMHESGDGTQKLLLALPDGREIESVLIPRGAAAPGDLYGAEEPEASDGTLPVTQCVSSQVGCAMGCVFCASGIAGLKRQLSAAEIVGQVLEARRGLGARGRLAGVVLMGMGEPLHNYDAVARALRLLNHPEGVGMSLRRVTLSTSGLVEGIDRLGRDFGGQVGLAVSLHAADDATRSRLMPINRRHPLSDLLAALARYPLAPHRRITLEYTLIAGENDSRDAADELATRVRGLRVKVNLIPMNPVPGSDLGAPSPAVVDAFQAVLRARGVETFVRRRRGGDIAAACGQLALRGELPRVQLRQKRDR